MKVECPCCGSPTNALPFEVLVEVVTPVMAEVLEVLNRRPGTYVSASDISDHVYRRNSDGGPEAAEQSVTNVISYNRRKVAALGWAIQGKLGPGGGYRLVISENARISGKGSAQ